MKKLGYDTLTIDNNKDLNPDINTNILTYPVTKYKDNYDILWASPPCTAFSVASMYHHWKKINNIFIPQTQTALTGIELLEKTIKIILELKPKIWYIENPRGIMRKIINDKFKKYGLKNYRRATITYCQYGDNRMKPTDIWTNNFTWIPRLVCKNGDKCHISAPRGARTGTQGMKNAIEKGKIPENLFFEITNQNKQQTTFEVV